MKQKVWTIRILAVFLAVMAAGTVVSRAADSVLVARVSVKKPERGRLTYSCEGEGCVAFAREEQIFLWPDMQAEQVAEPGSRVKAGECLVQFRQEYLEQLIEKKELELAQLELQVRQQQVSAREPMRVPASAGAFLAMEEAVRGLEGARQKESEARNAYESFIQTPVSEEPEDVQESGRWEAKKQELETALREAQAGVEEAEQTLNQAQNEKELADKEDAVQDANAANAAEAAGLGAAASQVQAEAAKLELKRLYSYRESGGKILAQSDCTVLQAGLQPGAVTTGSEVFVIGYGGFRLKGMIKEEDRSNIKPGAQVKVSLETGKDLETSIETLETGVTKEAGSSAGLSGTEDGEASETGTAWYGTLPDYAQVQGWESFTWTMEISSAKEYEQIIPLSALRENVTGAYCLALSEEEQMLGSVQVAKRVPVRVLEKDKKSAAVASTLRDTDKIIVSSEKYVEEGDRIRIKE